MAAQAILDRKASSALKSPQAPPSPHTPQRGISSAFSSPGGGGSGYRADDEPVILDIGARGLRAGFAGAWAPRCTLGFGLEVARRVGDYRRWLPGYDAEARRRRKPADAWAAEHELWPLDARRADLGLVEDKLERAIREAYATHLLLEPKARRVVLVASTAMPHPFLAIVLGLLFDRFQVPGIALVPPAPMAVLAAGLRAGLVVDIGWHETVVTAVDEFREVHERRTTRAMKLVAQEMGMLMDRSRNDIAKRPSGGDAEEASDGVKQNDATIKTHFEYSEEVLTRMAWCQTTPHEDLEHGFASLMVGTRAAEIGPEYDANAEVSIPGPSPSSPPLSLKFSVLSGPVESALFTPSSAPRQQDDHEGILPLLLYEALLSLPPDTRGACMSRILFAGGGSRIPGLKSRLILELERLVESRGWDPVWGSAADKRRARLREIDHNRRTGGQTQTAGTQVNGGSENEKPALAAGLEPQISDPIEDKLRQESLKGVKPTVSGIVRGVDTLGAWAGASLAASLRVKPVVEIEREQFLQQGLAGARREVDANATNARQSYGQGLARPGGADAWTLGAWA